ncbi:heavy metal translocating P-type ATPase [Vibrio tetraodonis]|uniref:heavy metal translocating P-type ATPase n=1 Tax=Vibrio tetraodonis TaxID=2231647 RepID=UPI000E0CB7A2|nr:heavy metal translocating P-type ATPase [Vibrio tetraodonis]
MQRLDIPLSGLSCMGCARKVERLLVHEHGALIHELTPALVCLETNSPFKDIESSILTLGYHAGHQYHFHLEGLSCTKCVAKLENALNSHTGIGHFQVSKTELSLSTLLSEQEIKDLVESVGYKASHEQSEIPESQQQTSSQSEPLTLTEKSSTYTLNFFISGMTCASCVASVERALISVDKVERAQVNLAEQSAIVFSLSNEESVIASVVDTVNKAGYQAEYVLDPETQQKEQLSKQKSIQGQHKKSAWQGLIIGAPLMLWGVLGGNMMIRSTQDQLIWGAIGMICLWLLATAGRSFFTNAWQALRNKRATMDTLVALGTGAAWLFSMLIVSFPQWFPQASRHVYFEASAMIIGLISLGHYIEAKAKAKTTLSLQSLMNLQPSNATVITESGDKVMAIKEITQGMQLKIKPGEKIPVDGFVLSGQSYLNESMLTGEPIPVFKEQGSQVSAGAVNQDGSLVIEATSVGRNTMLARIINMVRTAQSSKPAIAKLADQISSVFVPVVVVIALISALVWLLYGPEPKASYMLIVSTTVLIIACPCALGLATPLSVTVGIGKAAEMGILIKDADVLQSASRINTVVFDKTGTLTQGKPQVESVFVKERDESHLLTLAASLEQYSEHPLAKAIVDLAAQKNLHLEEVSQFTNLRGMGVTGLVNDELTSVVSLNYARQQGINTDAFNSEIEQCATYAWTPVIVVQKNNVVGIIAISDPIKPDAKQAIDALNSMGINTVMLTGDNQDVANSIASQIGIKTIIAQVLPDQKAQHIKQLQTQGLRVAMIGDGVNDAPALATADISIAMGNGSDVAIESAQMTLLHSSPVGVVKAIELSKASIRNMKQNLFGAFIYNSLGIPIAAGALYPAFGFLLSPVVAGAAMALSSITVVSNANRLRLFKPSHHIKRSL